MVLNIQLALPHRQWRYNEDVLEFYVVDDDRTKVKQAEVTKEIEETEMGETG